MASHPAAGLALETLEITMQDSRISDEEELDILHTVHVEVRLKKRSTARVDFIKQLVLDQLSQDDTLCVPSDITGWESEARLEQNIDRIAACETCEYFWKYMLILRVNKWI
jgi:hypothetical protein